MSIDLAQLHGCIVKELRLKRSMGESMSALIDTCESCCPHTDWARFRSLPFEDFSPLLNWVQLPFREEPPVRQLRGLWFGIFNPVRNGETVTDMYVSGSERFIPDPNDNDWAVRPEWWPGSRYAHSCVLAEIHRIASRKAGLENDATYPLCLGYAAFAVRGILLQIKPTLLLGQADGLGVAVGFDSGDFVLLGNLTQRGIVPFDPNFIRPEPDIQPVLERLRCTDSKKAFFAMLELPKFGDRARIALPDLLRLADSAPDFGTRQAAMMILPKIAPDDPRVKKAILEAFKVSNPFVRKEALQAIISIKELTADDLADITNMENDSDDEVARWSEIALRNIRLKNTSPRS